jgi:hypothetical protein
MQSMTRLGRLALVSWVAIVMAACAGQKEPAQKLLADIDATVMAAAPEAAKYVPEQLSDVQSKFAALKASFDKQDYPTVVTGAPAVLGAAQSLATAAAAKKDEVLKTLNDNWTTLAGTVPNIVAALQKRIDFLSMKSSKKLAAGIDLDSAKAGLSDASSLWSKAQAAFASGSMDEAVRTAREVKAKVEAVAATLKLDLTGPAARS